MHLFMKKLSVILASMVLFAGISFAGPIQQKKTEKKETKKETKKTTKKGIKKVPSKKKAEKKDEKSAK